MLSVLETVRIPLMIEPHICGRREHWALDGAVGKWELMDGGREVKWRPCQGPEERCDSITKVTVAAEVEVGKGRWGQITRNGLIIG